MLLLSPGDTEGTLLQTAEGGGLILRAVEQVPGVMDLPWGRGTSQTLLLMSMWSRPRGGRCTQHRWTVPGHRLPGRLSAAFRSEGHWQTCFSYCSFISFSSVFVLFISLRQLSEFFFVLLCCWLTSPPCPNLHGGISSFSFQASQVVYRGRAAAR